jgi:hypothetical protein
MHNATSMIRDNLAAIPYSSINFDLLWLQAENSQPTLYEYSTAI